MDDEDKRLARVFTNATSTALFGAFYPSRFQPEKKILFHSFPEKRMRRLFVLC